MRPRKSTEKWLNQLERDLEATRQYELVKQPNDLNTVKAANKTQEYLISALKKVNSGRKSELTDQEIEARLDHASQGVTNETRQAEALAAWKEKEAENRRIDLARDKILRLKREYETV